MAAGNGKSSTPFGPNAAPLAVEHYARCLLAVELIPGPLCRRRPTPPTAVLALSLDQKPDGTATQVLTSRAACSVDGQSLPTSGGGCQPRHDLRLCPNGQVSAMSASPGIFLPFSCGRRVGSDTPTGVDRRLPDGLTPWSACGPGFAPRPISEPTAVRRRCRSRSSPRSARRAPRRRTRPGSGRPRQITRTVKSMVRDRVPTRVTTASTSSTSPARTGARNCTSEYDANSPSSPSVRMQTSVATSPNRPRLYAPSTRLPA